MYLSKKPKPLSKKVAPEHVQYLAQAMPQTVRNLEIQNTFALAFLLDQLADIPNCYLIIGTRMDKQQFSLNFNVEGQKQTAYFSSLQDLPDVLKKLTTIEYIEEGQYVNEETGEIIEESPF